MFVVELLQTILFARNRFLILIGYAAILLIGLPGCGQAPEPKITERIVVSSSPYVLSGLLFLAIDQKLFEQQGLEVAVDLKASGKQSLEAMFEQESRIALATETPIMEAIMEGKPLAILGSLGECFGDLALVGRSDRGIASPKDLQGKTIAVEIGTSVEYFLDALLSDHGIKREEVKIVPTSTDRIGEALASGEVDAGIGWQPYISDWLKQLGSNAYRYSNPHYYTLTWFVSAERDYAANHRETLKKFFRALSEAERYYQAKPEEMRRVLAERAGINEDLNDPNVYRFALRADQSMLVILESLSRWALQRGIVPEQPVPNYLNYFDTAPLEAVKPEAVTIIR